MAKQVSAKRRKISKRTRKEWTVGYLMIAPTVIGLIILNIYPFLQTLYMSFCKGGMFGKMDFSGTFNYAKMFKEEYFWNANVSSALFMLYTVPIGVLLALILAALLNSKIKGKTIFRAIYFLPMVVSGAAVAMVWKWMFHSQVGILNEFLGFFGIPNQVWLTENPNLAIFCVSIVAIWAAIGYDAILLLSGIQSISKNYYEAAEIDGASSFQKFKSITVPLVSPTLFFVIIMRVMASIKVFDIFYMMIEDSNPIVNKVRPLMVYYYREGFEKSDRAYASAVVVWTFLLIMLITLVQFRGQKKWVNYDA